MEYYSGSPRARSYRGSSFRGSPRGDSYRSSRGSSRGGHWGRGRGSSNYYDSSAPKYSPSEGSKYGSSSRSYEPLYTRRSESGYRDDSPPRKRMRGDSYGSSQGLYSRRQDDDYRDSGRYSGSSHVESRYDDRFKKPRSDYKPLKDDRRIKEPLRPRSTRGRISSRGLRRGEGIRSRPRGSARYRTATTTEILAIRRAKLLQNRLKAQKLDKGNSESDKKEGSVSGDGTKEQSEDGEIGGEGKIKEEPERKNYFGKPFMKLQCPHCNTKCITFKEYAKHLHSPIHILAMKEKSTDLKSNLAAMRIAQREKQKAVDAEDLTSMTTRSLFCLICKLNYSQDKETHQATELHKKLKEFLMPYCRVCRISFDSPMSHETHLCSLDHIRRKHAREERDKASTDVLDKFMVLDSVSGGDETEEKEEEAEKKDAETKVDDLTLGVEFIRTIKAKYCEVCRRYLPRAGDPEKTIKRHCRTKEHLRCYLHFGNEALLEKMHEDDVEEEKKDEEAPSTEEKPEGDEGLEGDKMWSDIGNLLKETDPNMKSDDEDDEEGGRFDRFKTNEKKENGDLSEDDNDQEEKEEDGPEDTTEEKPAAEGSE